MTMRGDDAVLTTYNQMLEEILKSTPTPLTYVRQPRNIYLLPVPTALATEVMASNWLTGKGVALMLFPGSRPGRPEQAERKGVGKYYGRRGRKARHI